MLDLHGKVLVVGRTAGVSSERRDNPTSGAGGPSVITGLRKGKKSCAAAVRNRSEKKK